MTPKLIDRLARLEGTQAAQDAAAGMPRETVQAWLLSVAVALGDYPRSRQPASSYLADTVGDGFARGLGYADRDDMEVQATADPDDWRRRIVGASDSLRERYRADVGPAAEADDDAALARALAFYGTKPESPEVAR